MSQVQKHVGLSGKYTHLRHFANSAKVGEGAIFEEKRYICFLSMFAIGYVHWTGYLTDNVILNIVCGYILLYSRHRHGFVLDRTKIIRPPDAR